MKSIHRAIGWGLTCALLLATPVLLWARDAELELKDGRKLKGELVSETDKAVTLKIAGITTTVVREDIAKVAYIKTAAEQFKEMRAAAKDEDLDGRYNAAYFAFQNGELQLAKAELADLKKRWPEVNRVKLLSDLVDQNIKGRDQTSGAHAPPPKPDVKPVVKVDGKADPKPAGPLPTNVLTAADVNLIRVYEIDPAGEPARVSVPREVQDTFFKDYGDKAGLTTRADQERFRTLKGWQQLDAIFKARARELYPKVKVEEDPAPLAAFRKEIHRSYVLQYCGSVACHGGPEAGKYFVFRDDPNMDATVYTNFFVARKFETSRGYMIDVAQPEKSLLVQFGLPRSVATYAHPDVGDWSPNFRSERDPRFENMVQWVGTLGRQQVVPYMTLVDYKMPALPSKLPAATQPAAGKEAAPAPSAKPAAPAGPTKVVK